MKSFACFVLVVFVVVGCRASVEVDTKTPNNVAAKPEEKPADTSVIVRYDWYANSASEYDCDALKKEYYPGNAGNFDMILRGADAANLTVKVMTEYASDDTQQKEGFIDLLYFCDELAGGTVIFKTRKDGKPIEVSVTGNASRNPLLFYETGFKRLLEKMDGKNPSDDFVGEEEDEEELEEEESEETDPMEIAKQECVDKINAFRATIGMRPLQRWKEGEKCADAQAEADFKANSVHGSFNSCTGQSFGKGKKKVTKKKKKGEEAGGESANVFLCACRERGQNTCPNYPSVEDVNKTCIQKMWDEGPSGTKRCAGECYEDHGHYLSMTNPWYTKVACGFYVDEETGKVWSNHNFTK